MRRRAIPFRTGRTTVGERSGGQDVHSEQGPAAGGREVVRFTVKSSSGLCTLVEAAPSDTVEDLKPILHEKLGTPAHLMELFFRDEALDDRCTLGACGIMDGCVIYLIPALRGGSIPPDNPKDTVITLKIYIDPEKMISVEAASDDSILSIKQTIEKETGVPVAQQTLWFEHELSDDKTVTFYDLSSGCTLRLEKK
ncbi:uncharacterized protein LOC144180613 [Haemaphysalis longicornis]